MSDDKKWKVDEETRRKMSYAHRQAWERGERKAPITSLKEELTGVKDRLTQVELDIERMKRRDARIREVFKRHREITDKGRKQPEGHPIRSFMDDLMDAWDSED